MTDQPRQQNAQIGAAPASAQPGTPMTARAGAERAQQIARAPGTGSVGSSATAPQQQATQTGAQPNSQPRPSFTDWASI